MGIAEFPTIKIILGSKNSEQLLDDKVEKTLDLVATFYCFIYQQTGGSGARNR